MNDNVFKQNSKQPDSKNNQTHPDCGDTQHLNMERSEGGFNALLRDVPRSRKKKLAIGKCCLTVVDISNEISKTAIFLLGSRI